ncbi:MAG: TIGR03936 family radical SAM-associated protein [Sedimentisphaerales bacterium]
MYITVSKEAILVLIKFRVQGALRYICHAEMLKIFQRACARAGIKIQHSRGFNPRPRLSLPLPRPVGIESDGDLLCFRVEHDQNEPQAREYKSLIKDKLSAQLPAGCELLSVEGSEAKSTPQPRCVTYILSVRPEYADNRLKETIKLLSERKHIIVERKIDAEKSKIENQKSKIKEVDVRTFLKSIELDDRGVIVECKVTSAGSIRVDEILKLLEIDVEKLTAPVKRTNIQWQEV